MNLGQYLFLDTHPDLDLKSNAITLEFDGYYYYQNGKESLLLNTKTKEDLSDINLTQFKPLSTQLNHKFNINDNDFRCDIFEIRIGDVFLYEEHVDRVLFKFYDEGNKRQSEFNLVWKIGMYKHGTYNHFIWLIELFERLY